MAKKLFPEYYWKPVYEGDDINNQAYLDKNNIFHFETEIRKNVFQYMEIHWFEFCFYHLIPKLDLKPLWTDSIYEDCFIKAIHPIDYLYVAFKKLKL